MSRDLVECVPNFSEGRDPARLAPVLEAIAGVAGVSLLGHEMDADHNRSVVTFVGARAAVGEAAFRATRAAAAVIDLNRHTGEHPRMGATDVVPFVPIEGIGM